MKRMEDHKIKIVSYTNNHKFDIDRMIGEIALEFDNPISLKPTDSTPTIPDQYWVVIYNDEVIGTIGVIEIKKRSAVLKRMFLKKPFRGKILGISKLLLQTAINWCIENGIEQIYLGTMDQFKAAQMFYLKNGFESISKNELPNDFLHNQLDNVFFVRNLNIM